MNLHEKQLVELAAEAVRCRICFQQDGVKPPLHDLAQPRLAGSMYWESSPRVVVLLINPGEGKGWADQRNLRSRELIRTFAQNPSWEKLEPIRQHQYKGLHEWGRGRFWRFFVEGVGLNPEKITVANIAWCATKGNKHPRSMLNECFSRHTEPLLRILYPDVVILSGGDVHPFGPHISRLLPKCKVVSALHYSHREGLQVEAAEVSRLKQAIANL